MRLSKRPVLRVVFAAVGAVLIAGAGSAVAAIIANPQSPQTNQLVTFTEASCDSVLPPFECVWDLGNGTSTTGPSATRTYASSGEKTVTVTIPGLPETVESTTFTVTDPPTTPTIPPIDPRAGDPPPFVTPEPIPPTKGTAAHDLLSPFPRVRMAGNLTRRGAKITLLFVRAPKGSTISAKCVKVCRKKRTTRAVKSSRDVRVSRLYGNYRAGAVIRITVTKRGLIGKYTSITIRHNKAPKRVDRCIWPGGKLPRKCPSRS